MTIFQKLAIAIMIFVLALIGVGGYGIKALGDSKDRVEFVTGNILPSLTLLSNSNINIREVRAALVALPLVEDQVQRTAQLKSAMDKLASVDKFMADYKQNYIADDRDAQMTNNIIQLLASYRQSIDTLYKEGSIQKIDTAAEGAKKQTEQALVKSLQEQREYNLTLASNQEKANKDSYNSTLYTLIGLIIVSVAVAGSLALVILLYVRRSLNHLQHTLLTISDSLDLTLQADDSRHDEIGKTAQALNSLTERFATVLADVRTASESVATASNEIAAANIDLSARTEEQAASLAQTAASMHEISSTVESNVENARQANSLGQQAADAVAHGDDSVERMMQAMKAIASGSEKVAEITTLIEGIAFQTNILALNAAVEAARAGEHGRGFAVVAGEVRTLSQRSSSAAREIKTLIDNAIGAVKNGSQQADDVRNAISNVKTLITNASSLVGEMSLASEEQSRGISQINVAINQMEAVTQQNAAMVEQASSAAESLNDQAARLRQLVEIFRLNAGGERQQFGEVSAPRLSVGMR
ncbi:methyl-accepting chemotaxis protein [Dickeya zeae]|uniref:methyl-accepting chemotaxis protein n=1 Tax=Dickeya zeae TaxID=204042 RepID=UPI001C62FC89|nr:methyl-accepting chemotaxis protein [Dickeya zeae]